MTKSITLRLPPLRTPSRIQPQAHEGVRTPSGPPPDPLRTPSSGPLRPRPDVVQPQAHGGGGSGGRQLACGRRNTWHEDGVHAGGGGGVAVPPLPSLAAVQHPPPGGRPEGGRG
eukprot:292181-Prorocentrum_minimum.AAC.1